MATKMHAITAYRPRIDLGDAANEERCLELGRIQKLGEHCKATTDACT